jgi:hypothetical protein
MSAPVDAIIDLCRMRRATYTFLAGPAPLYFAAMEASGQSLPLPPSLSLPSAEGAEAGPGERLVRLAADEAARLASGEVFALDAEATAAAVSYGRRLRARAATITPPGSGKIAMHGIFPPAPAGFLRWACPITGPGDQRPVIAAHWGRVTTPQTSGVWLVLWADQHTAVTNSLLQDPPPWWTADLTSDLFAFVGPLHYEWPTFISDPTAQHPGKDPDEPLPVTPYTSLRSLPLETLPADEAGADQADTAVLPYILLASWALLTPDPQFPDPPHLTRHPAPSQEAEADRQAGLPTRPAILAAAPTVRPSDPYPEELGEDLHRLMMRIVALVAPDAPDGPPPEAVVAEILDRWETPMVLAAAYAGNSKLLEVLAEQTGTSRRALTGEIAAVLSEGATPFDAAAWAALPDLLQDPSPEPVLPPPAVAAADLLWALATFQALAMMRLADSASAPHRLASRPSSPAAKQPRSTGRTSRSRRRR